MKTVFSFALLLALFLPNPVHAQMGLEGFSSGRYERRPASTTKKARLPTSDSEEGPVVTDTEGVKVRTMKASELEAEKKASQDVSKAKEQKVELEEKVDQKSVEATTEVQEPGIAEQAQSLFANKAGEIHEFYRESIHPDDVRNNRVEIDITPALIYNEAQSNYSLRDYNSFFNALKFRANVWLTPLIGVSGQILFSFAADVDEVGSASKVPAKYEMVDLGLNFRRFFGVSRKSNSVEFSLLLSDSKMTVPSDSTSRGRLKSQGLGVGIKARFPISANYAWVFGGNFFPRLQHSESDTGIVVHSGSPEESVRAGLDVGGEWKFSRQSQMIWSLGLSTERNLFDGSASLPDPSSGGTPSNVSVTNSLYMFSLGYRWGH